MITCPSCGHSFDPAPPPANRAAFFIDGQEIPFTFWQKVVNYLRGDKYQAQLVFYRAHYAEAKNIIAWTTKGLNEGYVLKSCKDEYDNIPKVKKWCDDMFTEIPKGV